VRGGGAGKDGAAAEEDGSVSAKARMHANRTSTFWMEEEYDHGQIPYAWRVWWSIAQRGRNKRGTLVVLEAAGCGRRAEVSLARFILPALSGNCIQFLVIFSLPDIKEEFELVDREFAAKVAPKDGRKSKLAVAGIRLLLPWPDTCDLL